LIFIKFRAKSYDTAQRIITLICENSQRTRLRSGCS